MGVIIVLLASVANLNPAGYILAAFFAFFVSKYHIRKICCRWPWAIIGYILAFGLIFFFLIDNTPYFLELQSSSDTPSGF